MSKIVWAKRSEEWIKANPGKGTMYKTELIEGNDPPINLLHPIRNSIKNAKKNKEANDVGIYVIICEIEKSAYVGQSINMGTRLRNHKMQIVGEKIPDVKTYHKIREHFVKHGIVQFEFKRYLLMPDANTDQLTDAENRIIWEFKKNGYSIYNTIILGNIYCPDDMKEVIQKLIFLAADSKELQNKIKLLID